MHIEAAPTGEPAHAPASNFKVASAATILPFLSAPILTFIYEPEVGPDASRTSALVIVILTGAPDFLESKAATGST